MKVLMVGPSTELVGGMSTVAATLECHFRNDARFEVEMLDSGGGKGIRGYRLFPAALARVMRGDYDLLHLHVASKGSTLRKAMLAAAARARSIPYVVHLHGAGYVPFLESLGPRTRVRVRDFFLGAAGIVVLGEAWREVLTRDLAIPAGQITIVNNGVRQLNRIADKDKIPPRRVVFVGEFSHRKGGDLLAEAWGTLVDRGRAQGWSCVCLGPTPDDKLKASAVNLLSEQARSTFQLRGSVVGDPKDDLISGSSIFCLPSRAEGLPMALLEAMSAGVPSVCTNVGSIGEVVDECNGRLIHSGDSAALINALDELMTNDGLRARLSDGAFQTWQSRFTAVRMAERVADVWIADPKERHDTA